MYDLLIIGGGPAGLSAAMTARNRNLSVCVICGGAADSALYKAGHVTNYPGVPDVSGPALLETMTQQARDLAVQGLQSGREVHDQDHRRRILDGRLHLVGDEMHGVSPDHDRLGAGQFQLGAVGRRPDQQMLRRRW